MRPTVAILGAGSMGQVLAEGLLRAGWAADELVMAARREERAREAERLRAQLDLERALSVSHERGDWRTEARALLELGHISHLLGNDAAALTQCQEAVSTAKELNVPWLIATSLVPLGHALTGLGELEAAADAYRRALALRRELGFQHLLPELLAGLASVELARGDLDQAQTRVEEILDFLPGIHAGSSAASPVS